MTDNTKRFRNEEGATATEYIVLLVFIAIAIIAGATIFGGALNSFFEQSSDAVCEESDELDCPEVTP